MIHNHGVLKIITFSAFASALIAILAVAYRDYIVAYFNILTLEEYSYLVVLIPLTVGVVVKTFINYFDIAGVNVLRFITSLMFTSISILTYVLGDVAPEYYIELKTISIIFISWAFTALLLKPRKSLPGLLAMSSLLLLIPLPRPVLDYVSAMLTLYVAKLAAWSTGVGLTELYGRVVLVVNDPSGITRLLEVSLICGGVVSLTSVLAVSPAIVYIAGRSRAPLTKKLLAITTSLLTAAAIVFIGNYLRLVAVVLATRYWSYDAALTIFHQTPSLIYVVIAVVTSIYICSRLPRKYGVSTKASMHEVIRPTTAWATSLAMLVSITLLFILLAIPASHEALVGTTVPAISLPEFLREPTTKVLNVSGVKVLSDVPSPTLSVALGVPAIRHVMINYGGHTFMGYVEVAEVPSRFHGWYVCLTLQGYRIIKSWSEIGNVTMNFLLISKHGTELLLGYSIYRYKLQEATAPAYVRVSLITPVSKDNYGEVASIMRSLLSNIATTEEVQKSINILTYIMVLANVSVVLSLALVVISLCREYIQRLVKSITRLSKPSA